MELNLDFKNNLLKTICWILSLIFWILFLLTGWIGFFKLLIISYGNNISYNNVWCFINIYIKHYEKDRTSYLPLQTNRVFYIILFLILLILGTASFALYILKSTYKKDEHVFEGMMGKFSRYHFCPLICASALFIVGESQKISLFELGNDPNEETFENYLTLFNKYLADFSVMLIFSIIGLASLIFIKMKTELQHPLYVVYTIKDGFYSCLISLFVYSFFYSSIYIGVFNKMKIGYETFKKDPINTGKSFEIISSVYSLMKDCGITFSIMIGIINLTIGMVLKDILIPVMNFLIYLSLTIYFFSIKKEDRENNGVSIAEGLIDIIILIVSGVNAAFTTIKKFKPDWIKFE